MGVKQKACARCLSSELGNETQSLSSLGPQISAFNFFYSRFSHVRTYIHNPSYVCVPMHAHMCKPEMSYGFLNCVPPYFLRQLSHWTWNTQFLLGWLARELLDLPVSIFQCWVYKHSWPCLAFTWRLRIWTQILLFIHQCSSQLSNLSSPSQLLPTFLFASLRFQGDSRYVHCGCIQFTIWVFIRNNYDKVHMASIMAYL